MKTILIIAFLIVHSNLYSQKYTTEIGKANKVEVNDGVTHIKHADTILVEIYNDLKSTLFISGFDQRQDTSGIYLTTINFINPNSDVYEVDLKMLFDSPALDISIVDGVGMMNKEWSANKDYWVFTGTVRSTKGIKAVIKSKEKISVSMKGIQGVLKS